MTESRYEYLGSPGHQTLVGRQDDSPLERALTHRAAIMRILPGNSSQGRRGIACVLGAGECHDLDLAEMLKRYHEIHLVDCNGDRISAGLEQQKLRGHPRLIRRSGIDVSGAVALLDNYSNSRDEGLMDQILALETPDSLNSMGQFEVVLSANVLPELMAQALLCVGIEHPRMAEVIAALRLKHVETMLNLTSPGGQALLVIEVTTSQHIPKLVAAPKDLEAILGDPDGARWMNPGCNPAVIDRMLRESPVIVDRIERFDRSIAWLRQETTYTAAYLAWRMMLKA